MASIAINKAYTHQYYTNTKAKRKIDKNWKKKKKLIVIKNCDSTNFKNLMPKRSKEC